MARSLGKVLPEHPPAFGSQLSFLPGVSGGLFPKRNLALAVRSCFFFFFQLTRGQHLPRVEVPGGVESTAASGEAQLFGGHVG